MAAVRLVPDLDELLPFRFPSDEWSRRFGRRRWPAGGFRRCNGRRFRPKCLLKQLARDRSRIDAKLSPEDTHALVVRADRTRTVVVACVQPDQ